MFLRIVAGFVVLVVLLWAVAYAAGATAVRQAKEEPWPYGLGTLQQVEARAPAHAASAEAELASRLIDALDLGDADPQTYVAAQTAKRDDAIDPPSANAGLAGHEAPLAELVRLAVSAGNGLRWGPDGMPWQLDDAADLLAAAALERARNGDGAGAWEHVHAMWVLARSTKWDSSSFGPHAALRIERRINAVARKLAAPAPPWLAELGTIEPRRETAALIQQEALSSLRNRPALRGPLILFRPLASRFDATSIRHARMAAEAMAASPRCRIDTAKLDAAEAHAAVSNASEVYRAARIEAELEATAKVIALKTERARLGRWPPALADAGASRCAENHWIYAVEPNGSHMALRMSWEVAAEPDNKSAPALQFSY